jgi:hypothetical protein
MNWRDRFIRPQARAVYTWEGFLKHGDAKTYLEKISKLIRRIAAGEDLTPYLSDRIMKFGYVSRGASDRRPKGIEWSDKDYVLNAFEAHHLHLGQLSGARDWSPRTSALLFVIFGRDSARFLMVGNHDSFDDGTLAEAVAEARLGAGLEMGGCLPPKPALTATGRRSLERRGIATSLQVGDKAVMGALLTTAGTSILHTYYTQRMMQVIEAMEPALDRPETLRDWFAQQGWSSPSETRLRWCLNYCDLGVVEEMSGVFFSLLKWRR